MTKQDLINYIMLDLLSDDSSDEMLLFYSNEWYSKIHLLSEQQFLEIFRMSRNCFKRLEKKLFANAIIKLKLKLHLFCYFIAHKVTYREIRNVFGIPKSTIFVFVNEVAQLLAQKAIECIKFHTTEEYKNCMMVSKIWQV